MNTTQRLLLCALLIVGLSIIGFWSSRAGIPAPPGSAITNTNCPQRILLIRHGEKTGEPGDIHLSREGKARALALHQLFEASAGRPQPFPGPDFIFATHPSSNSQRPRDTVTPLALKLEVKINHDFHNTLEGLDRPGIKELVNEIRRQPKYARKTILICWHHGTLASLARALVVGTPNQTTVMPRIPREWHKAEFDRVWQIDYDAHGNATWSNRPQQLLPGDAQK